MVALGTRGEVERQGPQNGLDLVLLQTRDDRLHFFGARVFIGCNECDGCRIPQFQDEIEIREQAAEEIIGRLGLGGGPAVTIVSVAIQESGAPSRQVQVTGMMELFCQRKSNEKDGRIPKE